MEMKLSRENGKGFSLESVSWILSLSLVAMCFYLFSTSVYAGSGAKLAMLGDIESYIDYIVLMFKWIAALAIIMTAFLFFAQRPIWVYSLGLVIVCTVVANVKNILGLFEWGSGALIC